MTGSAEHTAGALADGSPRLNRGRKMTVRETK